MKVRLFYFILALVWVLAILTSNVEAKSHHHKQNQKKHRNIKQLDSISTPTTELKTHSSTTKITLESRPRRWITKMAMLSKSV